MKLIKYTCFLLLLLSAGWANAQRNNNDEELDRLIRQMRERMREQQVERDQPIEAPSTDEPDITVVEEDDSEPTYSTEGVTSDVEQQYLSNTLPERNISREEWRKLINGEDFTESRREPPKEDNNDLNRNYDGNRNRGGGGDGYNGDRLNRSDRPDRPLREPSSSGPSFLGIPSFVMFIVLGILIAFLIFLLLSGGSLKRNQKVKKKDYEISIDNLEDYIHESDLDRFLRECLAKGQYREAIRVYYLTVIRTLSEKKLIDWRKDKTNRAYMAEMRSHAKFGEFQQVTLTYERIWFGDSAFNKEDYPQAAALFQNMLKTI